MLCILNTQDKDQVIQVTLRETTWTGISELKLLWFKPIYRAAI